MRGLCRDDPWRLQPVLFQQGGPVAVASENAPLGRRLPYHRSAGEGPAQPTPLAAKLAGHGWTLGLGDQGFGDLLLALAHVRALVEANEIMGTPTELCYAGPRARLLARCRFPFTIEPRENGTVIRGRPIRTRAWSKPVAFIAAPERVPQWLDVTTNGITHVHSALPMRYYLAVEQHLGLRLPAETAAVLLFLSNVPRADPFHVVFVTASSLPSRKDFGIARFVAVGRALTDLSGRAMKFTFITASDLPLIRRRDIRDLEADVQGPDAVDCLDVFGSAELVIGNDTGLTHLAALTAREDGSSPTVVALYSRHSHTKWITGVHYHHAVATRFSQMLAVADASPSFDNLDQSAWGQASDITVLVPDAIAEFAGQCVSWW